MDLPNENINLNVDVDLEVQKKTESQDTLIVYKLKLAKTTEHIIFTFYITKCECFNTLAISIFVIYLKFFYNNII